MHQDWQEPVSVFEEKRNKEILKKFSPNSTQFIKIFLLEILALSIFIVLNLLNDLDFTLIRIYF